MYIFTEEAEKEAGLRLKDCLTYSDSVDFFNSAKSDVARGHNCLLNGINSLYGIHTSCDVELAKKWLEKGAEEFQDEDCRFALISLYLEAYGRIVSEFDISQVSQSSEAESSMKDFMEIVPKDVKEMEDFLSRILDSYYPLEDGVAGCPNGWQPFYFRAAFEETKQTGRYLRSWHKALSDKVLQCLWLPKVVLGVAKYVATLGRPSVSEKVVGYYLRAAEKGSNLAKIELGRILIAYPHRVSQDMKDWAQRAFGDSNPLTILVFLLSLYHEKNMKEAADVVIHFFLPLYYRYQTHFLEASSVFIPSLGNVDVTTWKTLSEDVQTSLMHLAEQGRADHQHIAGLFLLENGQKQEAVYYLKRAAAQGYTDSNGLLFDILSADLRTFLAEYMQEEGIQGVSERKDLMDKRDVEAISAFWGKYDSLLYETLGAGARAVDGRSVPPSEYASFLKELETLGAHVDLARVNTAKSEFYSLSNRLFSSGAHVRSI